MPSINYTTSGAVSVNLGLRNWTDQAAQHANLLSWCDLYPAARTETAGRIVACAPRAGTGGLTKTSTSLGPLPATYETHGAGDWTNGELDGLYFETAMPRDGFGVVCIAGLGATAQTQFRTLLGCYGGGAAIRIWRAPGGQWSWRYGSTDVAALTSTWAQGPLLVMGERIGNTCRLRLRDRAGTTAIVSGDVATTLPATLRVVLGQDEISDGAPGAAPSASQAWSEHILSAAVYAGPVLTDATVRGFWDEYFTTRFGA